MISKTNKHHTFSLRACLLPFYHPFPFLMCHEWWCFDAYWYTMRISWLTSLPCKPHIITQQHTNKLYSASIPRGPSRTIGKDFQRLGTLGACEGTTRKGSLRGLTFRWGPGSKFLGTNLDSFEENWVLELDPSFAPWFFKSWALFLSSFFFFFGSEPIWFSPPKIVRSKFNLDSTLFWVLDPSSRDHGSNLWALIQ